VCYMLIRQTSSARGFFLLLLMLVCSLLAFRPLPNIFADNDTGRNIAIFHQVCNDTFLFDWSSRVTWEAYNLLTLPVCLVENDGIYLFLFALPAPLSLFVFGPWRKGSLLMACAFLFSFTCFEFMTNALRQAASLFFLLGVFAYIGRPKYQFLFGVPALLLHDSFVFFVPLLLLLTVLQSNDRRVSAGLIYSLVAVGLIGLALLSWNIVYLSGEGEFADLLEVFQTKYEYEQSIWFQLFVALPVVWIFFASWCNHKVRGALEERLAIGYFTVVFIAVFFWFPYIPYRFAMSAVALQLFLAMRNNASSFRVPALIFLGLVLHMLVYALFSSNVTFVLFG
jgi:hypothetical protein